MRSAKLYSGEPRGRRWVVSRCCDLPCLLVRARSEVEGDLDRAVDDGLELIAISSILTRSPNFCISFIRFPNVLSERRRDFDIYKIKENKFDVCSPHLYFRSYNLSSATSSAGFSAKSSAGFFAKSSAGFSAASFFGAAAALAAVLIPRIRAVRTVLISVSLCYETAMATGQLRFTWERFV